MKKNHYEKLLPWCVTYQGTKKKCTGWMYLCRWPEILRVIFSKVSLKSDTLVNSAVSRDWWNYWSCYKYKFGSHLNWSFQQNRMSKLHKFTFCREHSNCLCLLCDTHLLKQSRKQSQEGHKAAHHGSFNQSASIVNNNKKQDLNSFFFFTFAIFSDLMLSKHFFKWGWTCKIKWKIMKCKLG